tara:strand:- start:304 stop:807 length:504 start_codon:yes stop_codon:yes gene_type:complete
MVTDVLAELQDAREPVPDADQITRWMKFDKDGDEKLTKNETTGFMKRFFDRSDANKDGFLDRKELESLQRRLAGNRDRNQQGAKGNRQQRMSTEELLKTAPDDVVIEADIAYRPGDSNARHLDIVRPKDDSEGARAAVVFVHGQMAGWKRIGIFSPLPRSLLYFFIG